MWGNWGFPKIESQQYSITIRNIEAIIFTALLPVLINIF